MKLSMIKYLPKTMATEQKTQRQWKQLQDMPEASGRRDYHSINENEFIMVPQFSAFTKGALWRYNISKNIWIKWYEYPDDMYCKHHTSALNDDKSKLYIFGDPGYIITVDLETGEFIKTKEEFYDGAHSKSLFINGQFHIFGGWESISKAHFVYNESEQKLIRTHDFVEMTDFNTLSSQSLLYLSSTNSVMIIPTRGKYLYCYSLETKTCTRLPMENSEGFIEQFLRAVLTKDEQFAICSMTRLGEDPTLTVLDVNGSAVIREGIEYPDCNVRQLFIRDNRWKAEILTFGYVHQEISYEEPEDVIRIIVCFMSCDILHVFGYEDKHFCIDVDQIINL